MHTYMYMFCLGFSSVSKCKKWLESGHRKVPFEIISRIRAKMIVSYLQLAIFFCITNSCDDQKQHICLLTSYTIFQCKILGKLPLSH